ncbi:MAG: YggT family protein [Acidimicrobiia bacterium]|nr:YggT family protein [Actinomycetota bacterium]NDE58424.1 YggT family protein [Acidimicrobiia bacterium]NDA77401.1 YggT family protein [Actinomycetota bacterium]NDD96222.1 YggT family protein [Actinomycetota bacterium]NDF32445.1 YggT family protein [Acidimicrobiia bacterium]
MGSLLASAIQIYSMLILVRVILSWFPSRGGALDSVRDWTVRLTEPVLGPVRRMLPAMGGLDLSPVLVLIVLNVLSANLR